MNLKYRIKKAYTELLFRMSSGENPLFLAYYKYIYKSPKGSLAEFLDDYSANHAPVTFLQVGANDGFVHDPLHKFIKRDHWRGIMLEPQPDVFNEYLSRLHRKRGEITPLNAALDTSDGKKTLYKIGISNERWATGLSSFNREVLVNSIKRGVVQHKARKRGIKLPENMEEMIIGQEIATISPETLLGRFGNERINLLAVDTEGFDYEIIKMLDLDRISPEVVIYEVANFDQKTADECRSYLEKRGYSCRTIGKDVLATRNLA